MPDNLYNLINLGTLPECKGIILDGNASFNNTAFFLTSGNLVAFDNANVYITSNSNFLCDPQFLDINTPLSNIFIYGGNSGEVLTTDGTGNLSWTAGGGGGNASFIANGTSNVSIPSANGNVLISAAGNANVMTISGSEVRINKTANLGNVGNVKISSGNAGEVLTTYGNGTLYWSVNGQLPVDSDSWNYYIQARGGNTTWINLASSNTKNAPSYLAGTSIDANNIYPWRQGTSSNTANTNGNNYYFESSTGTYAPANAAVLLLTSGDDNWYSMAVNNMNGNGAYRLNFNLVLVSNVDATIQFVPGYTNSVLGGTFWCGTELMYTVELTGNKQTIIDQIWNFSGNVGFANNAIFVRNITANSNVNFVVGSLTTTES